MEPKHPPTDPLTFRHPTLQDGMAIHDLIQASPPLDLNSSYLYFLQASHFADTCMLVELDGRIMGFVSAYFQPDNPQRLFIWQVAVAESARGLGLAKRMLLALIQRQPASRAISSIACTIGPSNKASQGLFQGFANQYGLQLNVQPFIREQDFGSAGHEAEDLYVLTAPNHTLINEKITKDTQ